MFIVILLKRIHLKRKERLDKLFLEKWRPILLENLYSESTSFASISAKNTTQFLILWNNLQDNLKGQEKERLNQLARSLDMDKVAMKMLSSRKLSKRLLAISVLGNLKEERAWEELSYLAESENTTLAMNAMHALAKIDPERAIKTVVIFMVHRQDWPDYKISLILNEIGASKFSRPLAEEILLLEPQKQTRILNMMNAGDGSVILPLVKQLLSTTDNYEVISSCLNLLSLFGDHRDIPMVKEYLHHEVSFVRMKAVKTLALIGDASELPAIEKCLMDKDWWVRYRAAEAIKLLPEIDNERILEIRDRQSDRFAIDILNYIIS